MQCLWMFRLDTLWASWLVFLWLSSHWFKHLLHCFSNWDNLTWTQIWWLGILSAKWRGDWRLQVFVDILDGKAKNFHCAVYKGLLTDLPERDCHIALHFYLWDILLLLTSFEYVAIHSRNQETGSQALWEAPHSDQAQMLVPSMMELENDRILELDMTVLLKLSALNGLAILSSC